MNADEQERERLAEIAAAGRQMLRALDRAGRLAAKFERAERRKNERRRRASS